jgi:hypothetical protein
VLVFLVIFGSRLAKYLTDSTISANLSLTYPVGLNTPWLESLPTNFSEALKDQYFLSADFPILSLLYPRSEKFVYLARRGETFSSIETKLALKSGILQKANPKIRRINPGQEIIIPINQD